ncbi:MAG: GEVED domain-containing protein [Pirellulales bacterium]
MHSAEKSVGSFGRRRQTHSRRRIPSRAPVHRRRPTLERLETRDLFAFFSFPAAYLEGNLTELATGESAPVRLQGSLIGQLNESVSSLALDEANQSLVSLTLDGFESHRFGALHLELDTQIPNVGKVIERTNATPGTLELPATSQFDLNFTLAVTSFDAPVPLTVTLQPSAPVRIETGVSQLPVGENDTFRSRARSIELLDSVSGIPLYVLSDLAFTWQPEMGRVSGQKFDDSNGNGQRDAGEVGLNGWLIVASDSSGTILDTQVTQDRDLNGDHSIDPATERGWYEFPALPPGSYFVTELLRPGWQETLPGPSTAEPPQAGPTANWLADVAPRQGAWRTAAKVAIDWPDDGNLDGQVDEVVTLGSTSSTVRLGWGASVAAVPQGPLDSVAAEISQLALSGPSSHGWLSLAGGDGQLDLAGGAQAILGGIRQQAGDATRADSHFDLDFTLAVGALQGQGGVALQPQTPLTVRATTDRLPLEGVVFAASAGVALEDDQQQTRARILGFEWVVLPEDALETASGYDLPVRLGGAFTNAHFGNHDAPQGPYGLDFGDAPAGYPTLLADDGARHVRNGRLFLGSAVDAEIDGNPDSLALGDDASSSGPVDDEDGVAFHGAAVIGTPLTLTVTASHAGLLDAWVDLNGDGDWADPGEQVFASESVSAGANVRQINIPVTAVAGTTMTRFRLSSAGGLSYTGEAADGEVEDHALVIRSSAAGRDYGDASNTPPSSYPTLESLGGASHQLTTGHYLGNFVDGETDGVPSVGADGDDLAGLPDEDGVRQLAPLVLGETGQLDVQASLPGFLNAWIDFNQDGDWEDAGEHVFDALPLAGGWNRLPVAVPEASDGARASAATAARFRFTADAAEGRLPGGGASTGEVEDHRLVLVYPTVELANGPWNLALGPSATSRGTLAPGLAGLSVSPLEADSLLPEFSQLTEQSFFFRLGTTGGESSLASLALRSVQTNYSSGNVVVQYGDPARFDPLQVTIIYTLSATDLSAVTIDEQVIITNLTAAPLDLTWFTLTDVDLNGRFGDQDVGRVVSEDLYVQDGQLGSQFQLQVATPPLPDGWEVSVGNGLRDRLMDNSPTNLGQTPAQGTNSERGNVVQAYQWHLALGVTDDDRTTLISLSHSFDVLPVVTPAGELLTSATGRQLTGGQVAAARTAPAELGSAGTSGVPGPAVCRGRCVLDPALAVGYDFVSASSNRFAEVQLPFGFGDDEYLVQVPDGQGGWLDSVVAAGVNHSFLTAFPGGVSHFRVLGIELIADVDPRDPLGFPTVVQFVDAQANWQVRQTAIPDRVYVDPLLNFREESTVSAFGQLEAGDIVTLKPDSPLEVTGLVFGQTAFPTRAAADAYLAALGVTDLTEVVDYLADFGDAPAPYPTLSADGGAVHGLGDGPRLGLGVDEDPDGQPTVGADGDDHNGTLDEDGVAFLNAWKVGGVAELRVTGETSLLNAWIDWNDDGDWNDAGEQVFTDQQLENGANLLSIPIPASAVADATIYSRFRVSTQGGLQPGGIAQDGEVEDYVVAVTKRTELQGQKFADVNANGRRDAGEPYLNGWTIQLLDGSNQVIASTITADFDANGDTVIDPATERGYYRFLDMDPGTYRLREVVPVDWTQTAPDYTATLSGSQVVPPSGSTASGMGWFGWDAATSTLAYAIDFSDIAGTTVGLQLSAGAAGSNGMPLHDLAQAAGLSPGFTGPVRGSVVLSATEATQLASGELYVALSTTGHLGGELRGQVTAGTTHVVTVANGTKLRALDFGNNPAAVRSSSYPATQAQLVLERPGGSQETIPLVGTSTMRLFVAGDGTAADTDSDGRDDVGQELATLQLVSFTSLGRVDVRLVTAQTSVGRVEEQSNDTVGKLDLPPFTASGSAASYLDVFFEVTITNGATVTVYHTAAAARVSGVVSADPLALGETLSGSGPLDLLDSQNQPTGYRLMSQSYTPSPLRPWHNIVNPLDVDNSGRVVPLDALMVINELNFPFYATNNALPAPVNPAAPPPPYVDVTASGSVEPRDALLVINFLNGLGSPEGEAAPVAAQVAVQVAADAVAETSGPLAAGVETRVETGTASGVGLLAMGGVTNGQSVRAGMVGAGLAGGVDAEQAGDPEASWSESAADAVWQEWGRAEEESELLGRRRLTLFGKQLRVAGLSTAWAVPTSPLTPTAPSGDICWPNE